MTTHEMRIFIPLVHSQKIMITSCNNQENENSVRLFTDNISTTTKFTANQRPCETAMTWPNNKMPKPGLW